MKISKIGLSFIGIFCVISSSSGRDEGKRELMSKQEVTEKYDKNGDGELDYREKMSFLRSLNEEERNLYRRKFNEQINKGVREVQREHQNNKREEDIRARINEAGKKLRRLVESGEITEEQARKRMQELRQRINESIKLHRDRHHESHEHGDRHHDAHEHGDRHHEGHDHRDRHHEGHEHRDRHHDEHEQRDRHHESHEHGDRHHDGHEHRDRHHDDFASEIKRHFTKIEVKLLIEKYSEISKLIHQLELDLINMEVDYETAEKEVEKKEILRLRKRTRLLWDRLKTKRHQTRDKILDICHKNEEHDEMSHEDKKFKEHIEGLIQERRSANARLEELFVALKQLDETDDESADAEREQIEIRIHRLESLLDKLTKQLESIDK